MRCKTVTTRKSNPSVSERDEMPDRLIYTKVKCGEDGIFGLVANRCDAFVLDGDVSDRRIIFEQYRAEGGIRWEPCADFGVEVAGGYPFEQRFRRGFDTRSDDTIAALTDEPYIKIAANVSF